MRYPQLKKRLLLESSILAAAVVVLGSGLYFLDSFSDDYQKGSEILSSKVNDIAAATNALSNKYDKIRRNDALYQKILRLQSEDGLNINQQVAKNRFNHLRDQYYLSNLHLSMSPITEIQDANYRRPTHVIVSSDVNIDFEGLSDEYAYGLLNAIQQEFPGSSKIAKLTLTREGAINSDSLRTISEKGAFPLIKGEIKFIWLGIKPVESSDNTNVSKPN